MWRLILTCVQVFSALAIIGLVLLQRGKGAEAGAGFGAGASGTVFGARGATTALSRATAIFAAIFMINSLALAYLGTESTRNAAAQNSILDEAAVKKPVPAPGSTQSAPAPAAAPAGLRARHSRRRHCDSLSHDVCGLAPLFHTDTGAGVRAACHPRCAIGDPGGVAQDRSSESLRAGKLLPGQ